jgi:hypothetical protein
MNGFTDRAGSRLTTPRLLRLKPEDVVVTGGRPLHSAKFTWVRGRGRGAAAGRGEAAPEGGARAATACHSRRATRAAARRRSPASPPRRPPSSTAPPPAR